VDAELPRVRFEPPRFRAGTDDQRSNIVRVRPVEALAQRGDGTEHILVSLFPDEPSRRHEEVMLVSPVAVAGAEPIDRDSPRRDQNLVARRAFEEKGFTRSLGRREEEVRRGDRKPAITPRERMAKRLGK